MGVGVVEHMAESMDLEIHGYIAHTKQPRPLGPL